MYRSLLLISLLVVFFRSSFAETIQLKSGKEVKGEVIEKIENYLMVKAADGKVEPYMIGDIEMIDGVTVDLYEKKKQEAPIKEREGALFIKLSRWVDNPTKDKFARSFYTSDDPERRLTILARTIFAPKLTAYEWAVAEVKSLASRVRNITQPQLVSIGNSEWVVLEWESMYNDAQIKSVNIKGQQYYSKKDAKDTLIEVSVMGPKKVFDTVGTKEIYDFLSNTKIVINSVDEVNEAEKIVSQESKSELKDKSQPAVLEDMAGIWEMFYQKNTYLMPENEPFGYPYQKFHFFRDGYLKNIGLTKPFDELTLRIWEKAPKLTTYKFLKPGFLLITETSGYKYIIIAEIITERCIEPLRPNAPRLDKGDIIFSYLSPKKQLYLQRYLRKVGAVTQNSSSEIIILKSGQTIEGKVVEKTDKYIKIDFQGVPLTYFFEDIDTINGQKPFLTTEKTEASLVDPVMPDSLKVEKDNQEAAENPETENQVKRIRDLPFTTVIITYKDKGETFNGEEIVYIDVSKGVVSKDTRVEGKAGCVTKNIWKRDICDGKTLSKIDLGQKKGASFKVKKGDAISNIFMEEMYLKYYKGQKIFLGKECKVYSSMPGEEFYFWEGILLKQKTTNHPMGKQFNVTKEAMNIKLEVPIGDDKFKAPEGVKVMTPEETSKDMKKMLESLKGVKKEDWEKMMKDIKKIKKD